MSISIDTITISSVEDRRMVLSSAQAARVIDIGTNWTRLRIGIRYCIQNTGANYVGADTFYLGAMASPAADMSNGPLTDNTSHFVGFINVNAFYYLNADKYTINSEQLYAKKVGATVTHGSGTNQSHVVTTNNTPYRCVSMVEIVKGTPNFTINQLAQSPGTGNLDVSLTTFKTALSAPTMAEAASAIHPWYSGAYTATLAVNEAVDGYLNAVCVAWGFVPSIYISDIGWAKIA